MSAMSSNACNAMPQHGLVKPLSDICALSNSCTDIMDTLLQVVDLVNRSSVYHTFHVAPQVKVQWIKVRRPGRSMHWTSMPDPPSWEVVQKPAYIQTEVCWDPIMHEPHGGELLGAHSPVVQAACPSRR